MNIVHIINFRHARDELNTYGTDCREESSVFCCADSPERSNVWGFDGENLVLKINGFSKIKYSKIWIDSIQIIFQNFSYAS